MTDAADNFAYQATWSLPDCQSGQNMSRQPQILRRLWSTALAVRAAQTADPFDFPDDQDVSRTKQSGSSETQAYAFSPFRLGELDGMRHDPRPGHRSVGMKIDDLLVLDQLAGDVADDGEAEGGSGDGPVQRRQVVGRKGNAPAATLGRSAAGFLRSRP